MNDIVNLIIKILLSVLGGAIGILLYLLKSQLNDMNQRISRIEQEIFHISKVYSDISRMETKMNSLEQRLDKIEKFLMEDLKIWVINNGDKIRKRLKKKGLL